ncbi:unnamed protein product [Linum trigynum]|uniref:SEC7 domain-containing protein n=1 Tax=Linum trigynum TaxID=586398 RepID=A0AAV2CTY3_9ROSI
MEVMEAEPMTNRKSKKKRIELGISCMLNTEVSSVLAVLRRPPADPTAAQFLSQEENNSDTALVHTFKSLRTLIFNPPQDWQTMDPAVYLTPFLDAIQSDDIPAAATSIALCSVLKILTVGIFDERTTGARDAINSVVIGITCCRLERTDPVSEDSVMMRILQILTAIMKHRTAILLADQAVCTVVNTCFQVVQQSASRGDLLQRSARYTMHELVRMIFSKLQDIEVKQGEELETDIDDDADFDGNLDSGYGIRSAVDIFHFLCSLLNVVEVVESEGNLYRTSDEDVQLFALVLINSAIELSGDAIGNHPKLLRMIQDDLFHHLIHYGTSSSPLVLSMICSTVLNIYHFLRRFVRLQLEAFFKFVLLRVASAGISAQLQEVAIEGIIDFCRQPTFIIEAYVNYDCDPVCINVFEETAKLLCKLSSPGASPSTSLQAQAFEGLVGIIHNIAENINREGDSTPLGPYPVHITEYSKFWMDRPLDGSEASISYLRTRKAQKRKLVIAGNHYSREERKGLEYLRLSLMFPDQPDPKDYAFFFRLTPGLDKTMIGDYLGDPDDFHIQVLKEFTCTFEFSGMILDTALRTYLATFRLPGESQKIQRILEAFSEQFYEQQPSDIFAGKDSVFVLCYSLIMLNTDQHNPQVKKKMTEEEFIRNNRAINAGEDLPREYLSELFQSISRKAISLFGQTGGQPEMNPGLWVELMSASKTLQPFYLADFDRRLGRDMFSSVAGPAVAALTAFFEQADEDELFHECVEALISVARIAQYGLEDALDEMLASLCKCTTLLNPYASSEETLFAFSHDLKPRMAVLAVFSIANNFGRAIRGAWRPILDCLLKLKKLKLLPSSVIELDSSFSDSEQSQNNGSVGSGGVGGVIFPSSSQDQRSRSTTMISKFSHFFSIDSMEESLSLGLNEFEQNRKVIKQCQIGSIFTNSWNLPNETLLYLGRSLIFASAGKGQKFATPIEEEETIEFCWDLIAALSFANINRLQDFWPSYHDNLLEAIHFPLFSAIPFAEKVIIALFRICLKLLSSARLDKLPEELIFKSINLMWTIDKQILDTCCESITKSVSKILIEYPANLQSFLGWKSVLHLLSVSGRHLETYDQSVETLIMLISDQTHVSRTNYPFCIDCTFGFVALKNSPLEKNLKILDLLAESVTLLVDWYKNYSDPGINMNFSTASTGSNPEFSPSTFSINLFIKLGEAFRKTSLARREEIRNHAIKSLWRSFELAEELDFSPANCMNCFNLVVFAMVDDLHEKMIEYSRREGAEREVRSMEGTLMLAMELLTDVYLQFLKQIAASPGFRTFWLGVLRRMDTCMKADLGVYGEAKLQEVIPGFLRKMITRMKGDEILVQKEDADLFEVTYIQIQWIAPSLKQELFPELEI